jgi:hypothetical protein
MPIEPILSEDRRCPSAFVQRILPGSVPGLLPVLCANDKEDDPANQRGEEEQHQNADSNEKHDTHHRSLQTNRIGSRGKRHEALRGFCVAAAGWLTSSLWTADMRRRATNLRCLLSFAEPGEIFE